jgi:hypothetical protein
MGAAGFADVHCEVVPLINLRYDPQTYSHSVISLLARFASKPLGEQTARAWADDVRAHGERGEYFFSLNRYLFLATRV